MILRSACRWKQVLVHVIAAGIAAMVLMAFASCVSEDRTATDDTRESPNVQVQTLQSGTAQRFGACYGAGRPLLKEGDCWWCASPLDTRLRGYDVAFAGMT